MSDDQKKKPEVPAASPTGMIAPPQYAQGFDGMAVAPFPDDVRKILAETPPHEDVQIKPDGIVFMPGVWWRRQLTRAFGAGGWALAPRGPARTVGNAVEYHGALYCLGRWVAEAVGGADNGYMSHADLIESARTDCLSKCCKDLGMASELWEKDWREAWQREYAEKYTVQSGKYAGKEQWRLKKRRAPRAANLMEGAATQPVNSGHVSGDRPPGAGDPDGQGDAGRDDKSAAPDTGEAADPAAYELVAKAFKAAKFTKGGIRQFLAALFGIDTAHGEPLKWIGALTADQCDTARVLLFAWGKPVYGQTLAGFREQGKVRPAEPEAAA
jgi:hypothetical protein